VTISDILSDASGSSVSLTGTLAAGTIENPGLLVAVGGRSTITSPALSNTGTIEVFDGTLRLTDEPLQLHKGTLTGGTLDVGNGTHGDAIVLPSGDRVSSIAAGTIDLSNGNIENESGANALASLSSIGRDGTLIASFDVGSLTLNGNLVSQGNLAAFGVDVRGNLVSEGLFAAGGVDVRGDYTQASTGTLSERFGLGLSVGKTATLSGTLEIGVRKTCTPQHGTIATAMTFAARDGMFTTTPSEFRVLYGAQSVQAQYEGPTNRNGCD
jgi:hypothetical protein